jgi:hypothetical protein
VRSAVAHAGGEARVSFVGYVDADVWGLYGDQSYLDSPYGPASSSYLWSNRYVVHLRSYAGERNTLRSGSGR